MTTQGSVRPLSVPVTPPALPRPAEPAPEPGIVPDPAAGGRTARGATARRRTAHGGTAGNAGRRRGHLARLFLGGPDDPRWARPALWAVLAVAAVLYGWGIAAQTGNSYYSAAVLSGTQCWKAFFFGALDAGGYITVDKPPLSLWAMALTARLIGGVNGWSLIGPQVVMGVAAVAVLYATVRRAFGHPAALIAALVLALTPITVAINRDNNPDTLLVLLLVLAAWALQRSLESGRLRWLLGCALFVGLAFNTKMLQAFVVLPGFALVYLLFAPGGLLRRLGNLLAAGVALVAASAWWMVIVDLWPAGDRPYIGGSTDNSVWDLVVGYNGLGRIFGASAGGGSGGGANFGGTAGLGRLFNDTMGGQISWLLPFAAIALVAGVILRGRAARTDLPRAALLMWGGWLAVHFAVFSLSEGGFHPYYVTAMAPAIGALVGAGTVMMSAAWRRGSWGRFAAPALAAALALTGAWSIVLLNRTPGWNPWLVWVVGVTTGLGAVALVAFAFSPVRNARIRTRLGVVAVVIGLVGALAGPAAYAATTAFGSAGAGGGNGSNPTAGPSVASSGMGGAGGGPQGAMAGGTPPARPSGAAMTSTGAAPTPDGGTAGAMSGGGMGGGISTALVSYLEQNQGEATWLVAVSSAQSASSIILETGKPVIAMGGFTGSDPAMTVAKLKSYFESGRLRYIMLGGDDRGGGSAEVTAWVKANCTLVSAATYGGSSTSTSASTSSTLSDSSTTGSATSGTALYRYDG